MQSRVENLKDYVIQGAKYTIPLGLVASFCMLKAYDSIASHIYTVDELNRLADLNGCGWTSGRQGVRAYCPYNYALAEEITQLAFEHGQNVTAAAIKTFWPAFVFPATFAGTAIYGIYGFCSSQNNLSEAQDIPTEQNDTSDDSSEEASTSVALFGFFAKNITLLRQDQTEQNLTIQTPL